ncbi:hypothetical protein COT97_05590 [Candidatus Falkowbacteria bacterium CG10_big_fil_rev_8_21_14_0_10_39_11]|uniref:GIY-YIG domain-containing protein n=1 Tax=Candidatus Falkowbacteria bacterium CG10_big_fil_rev_8_21_14_0_10_39_11 TaxID=1974565 RepID=A0A2H0V3J7_9BACT|nr:MAG: hypothetical protein COT97_05590 [Candidatus Falkowbacteria bacterium CG10_big_fil_rev_8_21_14_0_10_39_11]
MLRKFYVYILKCSDNSYYVGITSNLDNRLDIHQDGKNEDCYTYDKRPVALKHFEEYKYVEDAINREKQLKGWSRKKKEVLIALNYEKLIEYSKRTKES